MRKLLAIMSLSLLLLLAYRVSAQEQSVITCVITAADPPMAIVVCDGKDRTPFRVNFQLHSEWHFKDVKYFEGKNDERTEVVVDPVPSVGRVIKATEDDIPVASCQTRINRGLLDYQAQIPGQIPPMSYHAPPTDCGEFSPFLKSVLSRLKK